METDLDSANFYSVQAYDMAQQSGDSIMIANASYNRSSFLIQQRRLDEAAKLLEFNLQAGLNLRPRLLASSHLNLGAVYYLKEEWDLSLSHYLESIELYEEANDQVSLAKVYLQIGVIYGKLENEELSEYFFNRSAEVSKLAQGKTAHGDGREQLDSDNLEEQIRINRETLNGIEDPLNSRLAAIVYYNLSKLYFDIGSYREAVQFANRALQISNNVGFSSNHELLYFNLGNAYLKQYDYNKAAENFEKALSFGSRRRFRLEIFQGLTEAYSGAGRYRLALESSKRYSHVKDSLELLEENERIAAITAQFETEKQAAEIELLESDNLLKESKLTNQQNVMIAVGAGTVLLLTLLFFAYKNHRIKQNLEFSELTQKLLLMQLNPHFLFNALNGIQYFIRQNDVKKSSRYISSFSGLMRNILENSVEKFIPVEEDYDTIKDFLALQQLVNNNAFQFEVTTSEDLDIQNCCIPPMFTQPFVENAIIHGVKGIENGMIDVNYKLDGDQIEVIIEDNGKGIAEKSSSANRLHKSMGTSITRQRMENLQKSEKYPIELEVASKNEENGQQGTRVVLKFPLKYI